MQTQIHIDPVVTVVIPVYNRERYITDAIRSVLAQSFRNWELVIADDGSTDGTVNAVKKFDDPRITLLRLIHTGNIALLRNSAAAAGKGNFICFLDSDDLWPANKLAIQLQRLQAAGKKWGYGKYELINESGEPIMQNNNNYQPFSGWITGKILTNEAAVSVGSLMIKRELFEELNGFNTDQKLLYREDYDLALRLSLAAEADAASELLVSIREHSDRSTNTVNDAHERMVATYHEFMRIAPQKELMRIARKRKAYHLGESVVTAVNQKQFGTAAKRFCKAFAAGDKWRHLLSVGKRVVFSG